MSTPQEAWSQLLCPYFSDVVRKTLRPVMHAEGLVDEQLTRIGGVQFSNSSSFLEICYVPETAPAYSLALSVGLCSPSGERPFVGVPMWFCIPESHPVCRYSFWTFGDPSELKRALERAWSEVLAPFALAVARDELRLRALNSEFVRAAT